MRKGRKQQLKTAYEYDLLYAKRFYAYMHNRRKWVTKIKNRMIRRMRRELYADMMEEYTDYLDQ